MYVFAYGMLLLALLASLFGAGWAIVQAWNERAGQVRPAEVASPVATGALLVASAILLRALYLHDYRLEYVASYTDNVLAIFYRLTAFWAGQPGSLLFWALSVAVMGSLFLLTAGYGRQSRRRKLWFWIFFHTIMAFFALLLLCWNNPFVMLSPAPVDGRGLNPLLQNPGMVIHPPLLFLGYGGFTVPSCLALAEAVAGRDERGGAWHQASRGFLMTAWSFLTAGIVLGAWWAYMELGWGGYWGWDPVENASLIPWLVATGTLHTLAIERRQGKLSRANIFLIALTTIAGFFATFLVRSGVVDSVHAFGENAVGLPLAVFVLLFLALAVAASVLARRGGAEGLSSPASREGLLTFTTWLFLAIAAIILLATMWPVISRLWTAAPRGLDAGFYNRVCLPLASIVVALLAACPWLGWTGSITRKKGAAAMLALAVAAGALVAALGYTKVHPALTTAFAVAAAAACLWGIAARLLKKNNGGFPVATLGCHLGAALCALGIAFSGPYKVEADMSFLPGETDRVGGYTVKLLEAKEGRDAGYNFLLARLEVSKDGRVLGVLAPEKRIYDKYSGMSFSEVDVLPGPGEELYASLSAMEEDGTIIARVSVEPLVNWLWAGGALMTLFPLFAIRRRRQAAADAREAAE